MLQQTQVDTVIPYYEKWLARFPDLQTLAKAPVSEALKFWAGLGYYRRARMLHETARTVVKNYGGKFPQTTEELDKLPGIGRYTAGAIASIAFGERAPIVDGNVKRVLSRIFAVTAPIDTPRGEKKLWALAEEIVKTQNHPGDFNQALMELGATVCFPEKPRCLDCPVQKSCKAFAQKRVLDFPVKAKREPLEKIRTAALVLRQNGKVLVQKQPHDGRWGGLWMFPHWKDKKSMLKEWPFKELKHRMTVRHGFTKYQVTLEVYELIKTFPLSGETQSRWIKIKELSKFAFPSPHKKIAENLLNVS